MKRIVITAKSIEKIGKIFEKQTGDAFFYAMRQHKSIWPKLVKCSYLKDEDGTETVRIDAANSWATISAYGKDLLFTIYSEAPIFNGDDEIKFTLRKGKKNSDTLCGKLNGIALLLKYTIDAASSAVTTIPDKMKRYLDIKWPI